MEETRTRDLVLMGMSREQLEDRGEIILLAIRLARHTNQDANTIDILVDQLEALVYEEQCREDEENVPF